jgi:uncharacterized protein DUF6597
MSRHSDGEPSDTTPHHRVGGYHEFAPPPDLADAVEALWTHEVAGVQVAVHRVVPDAAVSLCFMGLRAPDGGTGAARLRVIGPVTAPQLFAPPIGHRMEALRVKLEWCRPVLGVAPWEHANAEPLYGDVRPDLVEPLEARLMASHATAGSWWRSRANASPVTTWPAGSCWRAWNRCDVARARPAWGSWPAG